MKAAGTLAAELLLLAWLAWNAWNLFRIPAGLSNGAWRRPMWWARLCSVTLFAGLVSWVWGIFSPGLDVEEECVLRHHQTFDDAYWDSHFREAQRFFPLHARCNAHYDLVPAWVNPTVVCCAVVSLAAAGVLLWFGAVRLSARLRYNS